MTSLKNSEVKHPLSFENHPHWPQARSILEQLISAGHRALLAGGAVRDGILGVSPKDFDIATDAGEEELQRLFPQALPVGRQFGIFILAHSDFQIEVAGFRKEGAYLDGRRPSEVMPGTPEDDANRRDFTINALFYDVKNQVVIDYVGGTQDIKSRLIRCVGKAEERFLEDHLRILRALRFVAQLGFELEENTYHAAKAHRELVLKVSPERITEEWFKLLRAKYPGRGLKLCQQMGLVELLFPHLESSQSIEWQQSFARERRASSESMLLAHMWHVRVQAYLSSREDIDFSKFSKELEKWLSHLRLSKATYSELARGLFLYHEIFVAKLGAGKLLVYILKTKNHRQWLRFWQERLSGDSKQELTLAKLDQRVAELETQGLDRPLLVGADLLAAGYQPGREMGDLLSASFEAQLQEKWPSKTEALAWLAQQKES